MLRTIESLIDHLPIDVYDADGTVVRRGIVALDTETGLVDSLVYFRDGSYSIDYGTGKARRRREFYPAPLTWKCITHEQATEARKHYLDFGGK